MEMLAQFYSRLGVQSHVRTTMRVALCLGRALEFVWRSSAGRAVACEESRRRRGDCLKSDGTLTDDGWACLKMCVRVSVCVRVPKAPLGCTR